MTFYQFTSRISMKKKNQQVESKIFLSEPVFFSWAPKKRIERKPGEILKLGIDTAHPTKPFKCFFFKKWNHLICPQRR